MSGWIKLHRDLLKKAIWQCSTSVQKAILITILLNVNHEPKEWEWQGQKFICQPGQMITSLSSLAQKSGDDVSVQNVRTALDKFSKHGFLINQSTNTGRLITVVNWAFYQSFDSGINKDISKEVTKHQQSTNKEVTTNKNDKNNKNIKNNIYCVHFEDLWKVYPRKNDKSAAYKAYQSRLQDGFSEDELFQAVKNYAAECERDHREQRYIKHGKTFLGSNTPFMDYLKQGVTDNGADQQRRPASDFYKQFLEDGDSDEC